MHPLSPDVFTYKHLTILYFFCSDPLRVFVLVLRSLFFSISFLFFDSNSMWPDSNSEASDSYSVRSDCYSVFSDSYSKPLDCYSMCSDNYSKPSDGNSLVCSTKRCWRRRWINTVIHLAKFMLLSVLLRISTCNFIKICKQINRHFII